MANVNSNRIPAIFCLAIIACLLFPACKHAEIKDTDEVLLFHSDEDAGSIINERIDQAMKQITELAPKLDVFKGPALKRKANEIKAEADDAYQYYDKWERRIMAAAGGKLSNGQPKNGNDTLIATRLLVTNNGGDTLRWHIEELREMLLKQIKDTTGVIITLPETVARQANGEDWKVQQFNKASVNKTLNLIEKFKGDARSSELIVLNQLLKESKKKR